ncbi:MAG: FG-GAP-like repeat-containing protein, partial [Pseudomonadota bacterium]
SLTFSYTVQAGDTSADLDIFSSSALSLNGATFKDAAGNHANVRLAAPGASGSLADQAALVIDGVAPAVSWPIMPVFSIQSQNYGLSNSLGPEPYSYSATFVDIADIDNDGDLDVFVGDSRGRVLTFLNTGSASSPAFAAAVPNAYGLTNVGFSAAPSFADIDADGDLDAFVGNSAGNMLVFLNTGSASSPAFSAAVTNPYGLSDVGFIAAPTLADIDGDGDLDAIVGNWDGNTLVFLNTGSASSPAFAAALTNPYGLGDAGASASHSFVDIDDDGDLDAFVGDTWFFLNTGSASNPAFAAPAANPYGLSSMLNKANASLVDIDGDGDLDAFVGGYYRAAEPDDFGNTLFVSEIRVFLNTGTLVAPLASSTPNGTYGTGSVITLTVRFDENVLVNTAGGTPTLQLETGTIDRFAIYSSGSGTNTLTFTYTVQAGDTSADLDIFSSAALALNGGTIRDAAGNNANLHLGAPGSGGSLAANAALVIVPGVISTGTGSNEIINGSSYSDTLDGAGGNDSLYGDAGNDVLKGDDGNDRLYGDAGNDTMRGGNGDDAYYVDSVGDVVIETSAVPATGGIDTVYSYLNGYTLGSNIERGVIRLDTGATLRGNALNNSLYGAAGEDSLYGLNGSDALQGDDGNDRLDGGEGNDTLTGGNGDDALLGGSEDDSLAGGAGDDTLTGGTGLDTMAGGNGNDAYHVDNAGDVVSETSSVPATGGIDTVYSYISSYTLSNNVERGVIKTSTVASLNGNALDN